MDLERARQAARYGGYAAVASAALTLGMVGYALYRGSAGPFENNYVASVQDPLILLEVALVAVLGVFMMRCGRVAAMTMFVFFLLTKILQFADTGSLSGLPVALVFLYFFGNAVRGTFAYHKRRREADPAYRGAKAWHFATGVPAFLTVAGGVTVAGLLSAGMLTPPQDQNTLTNDIKNYAPPDPVEEIKASGTATNTLTRD